MDENQDDDVEMEVEHRSEEEEEEVVEEERIKRRQEEWKEVKSTLPEEELGLFDQDDDEKAAAEPAQHQPEPAIKAILVFLVLWQAARDVSSVALEHLLKLLNVIFHLFQFSWAVAFPSSMYLLWKKLGMGDEKVTKYLVCEECHKLHEPTTTLQHCDHIKFPKHPTKKYRQPCGTPLFKTIDLNVKRLQQPRKIFPYLNIASQLRQLYSRPGFVEMLKQPRGGTEGILRDVWDGRMWKEQADFLGPFGLSLCLNVDWFQPFKGKKHSVGVLYLTILNLPRKERFKQENLIIAGIIPGPSEPDAAEMNNYLKPMVDELFSLHHSGIVVTSAAHPSGSLLKARLLCIVCDLPAARKIGGFMGFSATMGCSRCKKRFLRRGKTVVADYSGCDCERWERRTGKEQREQAMETKK